MPLFIHMRRHAGSKLPGTLMALARTLQLSTDRSNNHSRSQELRTFVYDVADL